MYSFWMVQSHDSILGEMRTSKSPPKYTVSIENEHLSLSVCMSNSKLIFDCLESFWGKIDLHTWDTYMCFWNVELSTEYFVLPDLEMMHFVGSSWTWMKSKSIHIFLEDRTGS